MTVVCSTRISPLSLHDALPISWQEAQRLLESIPEGAIEEAQRQFALSESVGQSRMVGLHQGRLGDARQLEVYPNVWAGVGLDRKSRRLNSSRTVGVYAVFCLKK